MTRVDVVNVSFSESGFVVLLKQRDGRRTLPIFVGPLEARSIAGELHHEEAPRPMTHDLFRNVLNSLQCKIVRAEVCDLKENTFYGKLIMEHDGGMLSIDSRPSDAIAMALRTSASIYVDDRIMAEAGVILEDAAEEDSPAQEPVEKLSELDCLKRELAKAIENERYEEAARLRDMISAAVKVQRDN